ncbi:hypothetical protein E3G68_005104 [Mycobacteroides abscessus]|uniref:DUF5131 family protein n=1 Tax=Mycobacteroides abscessus TaxID=36809 RepID=UPI001878D0F0|nr:hypothetical protein [Mycobacteroides abscessus]
MSVTPTSRRLPHRPGRHWPTRTTLWELDYRGDPIAWWPRVPEWRQPHSVRVDIDALLDHDAPEWLAHTFFQEIETADKHVFEVITTRPTRLRTIIIDREQHKRDYADAFDNHPLPGRRSSPAAHEARRRAGTPPRHIWLGVLITNQHDADQHIPPLLDTPAAIRFAVVDQDTPVDLTPWTSAAGCPATPHTCTQPSLDLVTMTIDETRPLNQTWINDLHTQGEVTNLPVDIHHAPPMRHTVTNGHNR